MLRQPLVFLCPLLLCGCASFIGLPAVDQLDWDPRDLNLSDCPRIDGYYSKPELFGYDYLIAFGRNFELYETYDERLMNYNIPVFYYIKTTPFGYYVKASNGIKSIEKKLNYDVKFFGCNNKHIVYRSVLSLNSYQEAGGGVSVSYGEVILHLNDSGDVVISVNNRMRKSRWISLESTSPVVVSQNRPSFVFKKLNYKPDFFH